MTDILLSSHHYERPRHYLSAKPSQTAFAKPDRYYIYSAKKVRQDPSIKDDDINIRKSRSAPSLINKRTSDDRKTVSRNISMVLENLLQSYENSQLPTHGQGEFFPITFHNFIGGTD